MLFRKQRIYADAAAATPVSVAATRELVRLLGLYGNPGSLHREAVDAKNELEKARVSVAQSVGAHPDELVFVGSGTEANNLAIVGVLRPLLRAHKGHVPLRAVTSAVEHASVLEPLRGLQQEGLELVLLPVDHEGLVSPKALAEAVTDQTVFVSLQLVNSEIGAIQPVRECAKELRYIKKMRFQRSDLKKPLPLYFHTDAAQAPLWLPLAVEKLGVDLMTLDAQKVMGPKGVGVLFAKRDVQFEGIVLGGDQEHGRRAGTENVPLVGAFAVALHVAQTETQKNTAAVREVCDYFVAEVLRRIPSAILHGPSITTNRDARIANNANISIPGLDGEMAVLALDAEGVAVSTRSACAVADEDPSHVLQALGLAPELSKTAIRFTFLPSATKRHAARIAELLAEIAKRYKTVI